MTTADEFTAAAEKLRADSDTPTRADVIAAASTSVACTCFVMNDEGVHAESCAKRTHRQEETR